MGWLSKCFGFTSSGRHDPEELELQLAIEVSKADQDEFSLLKRVEDEQFARAIEESLILEETSHRREEERQRPALQLEDNQQLALNVQNSLDEKETFLRPLKQKGRKDDGIQLEEDQRLAKTVQESLNVGGSPRFEGSGKTQLDEDEQLVKSILESSEAECSRRRLEKGKRKHAEDKVEEDQHLDVALPSICAGCDSAIEHGRSVHALDLVWHPNCFCCLACNTPIAVHEFSNSRGRFHKSCCKGRSGRNCYVCKQKFAGRLCSKHPFWLEGYCPSHETDGTSKCCSCERLEPWGTNYLILDDGRRLCLECYGSAIMDTYECVNLHIDIRDFFESLGLKLKKEFPLLLVERQALNRAKEEEHIDDQYVEETRGVCLSEVHTVPSVLRRPEEGPNNRLIVTAQPYKLTQACEVTAILILYGLPRLLTGYILAHELMHAWFKLEGYKNLKLELEEGICQVLAHMWLESQTYNCVDATAPSSSSSYSAVTSKKGDQSKFQRKLVEFFKWQIEKDTSPVYGDGFRKVDEVVLRDGLLETIKSWKAHQ